jgi:hypothetical protein
MKPTDSKRVQPDGTIMDLPALFAFFHPIFP